MAESAAMSNASAISSACGCDPDRLEQIDASTDASRPVIQQPR
jgi:hypothetical protein